jgi:hypothetical protein
MTLTEKAYWERQRKALGAKSQRPFVRLQPNTTGMSDDEALAWANIIALCEEDGDEAQTVALNEAACRRLRDLREGR